VRGCDEYRHPGVRAVSGGIGGRRAAPRLLHCPMLWRVLDKRILALGAKPG
jgi:hypothetical protein